MHCTVFISNLHVIDETIVISFSVDGAMKNCNLLAFSILLSAFIIIKKMIVENFGH